MSITSTAGAVAALDGLGDAYNGVADLELWTGTMPTDAGAAPGGSKLCSISMQATPFAAATPGTHEAVKVANLPITGTASAGGAAAFFRITNPGTSTMWQGTVTSTLIGTGELLIDDVNILINGTINITGLTIRLSSGGS